MIEKSYEEIKEGSVKGRYLPPEMLRPFLDQLGKKFPAEKAGISVEGRAIEKFVLGNGPVTVLMWSQMHGNESTTTKAVLDLMNAFHNGYGKSDALLQKLTLIIIPQLNPDGAQAYTRENAAGVDLNRDAQALTQPESKILRETFRKHAPAFCFNLHDQRTIFSAGSGPHPATLSFLAPAADAPGSLTESRLTSMSLISAINRELQRLIPGQIGRYDDAFNPNCVGDTFQMLSTPTILVEAGHFSGDYEREETRKYVFMAMWMALEYIASGGYKEEASAGYENIPENQKTFFDILIRNAQKVKGEEKPPYNAGILFREELRNGSVHFRPEIEKTGGLKGYHGHQEFDCLKEADLQRLRSMKEITTLLAEGKPKKTG
ncbi:Zinc carboxypeptidase [Muriicola jejuensis]|uniref:Peptidase M14 n=1 Tax=Muriicola jejuensis TaxID=504488 RepID=A0A6P0ULT7_9FLAO|nr:M14 metallopeptidase family protein [Muriicola jejuensis]NER11206.1 peptidase M14 [Muriicola jejuensis]SMP24245.1 Zinc carboxypeptidase [Muriicola jejuensis]